MGTINYCTSDYITMGIEPTQPYDLMKDADFLQYCKEEYPDIDPETIAEEEAERYAEDDRTNAESILANYSFYYFHIVIKSGYYEGFYIDIENNFPVFYDDYRERKEALQEVREIEKCLIDLANIGIVSCYPSWCMGYANRTQTLKDIKAACKAMRDEIRTTPTYRQYNRESA